MQWVLSGLGRTRSHSRRHQGASPRVSGLFLLQEVTRSCPGGPVLTLFLRRHSGGVCWTCRDLHRDGCLPSALLPQPPAGDALGPASASSRGPGLPGTGLSLPPAPLGQSRPGLHWPRRDSHAMVFSIRYRPGLSPPAHPRLSLLIQPLQEGMEGGVSLFSSCSVSELAPTGWGTELGGWSRRGSEPSPICAIADVLRCPLLGHMSECWLFGLGRVLGYSQILSYLL